MKKILFLVMLPFLSFKKQNNNSVDVFFGDSITFGNELYQLQYTSRWSKQYTVAINTNENNFARSGAAMTPGLNSGRPVFDINEVPAYHPSHKNIFVSYWVNDYLYGGTPASFATATSTAVDGILAKGWPAAKIVLCFNYLPESPGTWVDMTHAKAQQWLNALRGVQQAKGTSFLDFYTAIYNRSDKATYTGDLIHPTATWNGIMKDMALTNIEGPSTGLPAMLIGFSGQRQGNGNTLHWTIAQEKDVLQYEIERSENGSTWTSVGQVKSLGNTSSQRSYGFTDKEIKGGKYLYRLRIVDTNGSVRLSHIVIITGVKATAFKLNGMFPNPASAKLTLQVDAPVKDKVSLYLMDAAGRTVKAQQVNVEPGTNTLAIDLVEIKAGTYFVKVDGQTIQESLIGKFTKQ